MAAVEPSQSSLPLNEPAPARPLAPAEVVLRFLESVGRRSEAEFYVELFRKVPKESFAAISVDANVATYMLFSPIERRNDSLGRGRRRLLPGSKHRRPPRRGEKKAARGTNCSPPRRSSSFMATA